MIKIFSLTMLLFSLTSLAAAPSGRFLLSVGGGIVTDTKTELMWQKTSSAPLDHTAAIAACDTLALGALTDWRLPTVEELSTLRDMAKTQSNYMDIALSGEPADIYWSSTIVAGNPSSAWSIAFSDDVMNVAYDAFSTQRRVRCVRLNDGSPIVEPITTVYNSTDVPLAIPEAILQNTTPGVVESTLNISNTGTITDVNVQIDITHDWVGDLKVTLIHPDATEIVLVDRPGVPLISTVGCSQNNFAGTIFDDGAAGSIEGECVLGMATAPYQPVTPLNALNGKVLNGAWKLKVEDWAMGDVGTLNSWSVTVTYNTP